MEDAPGERRIGIANSELDQAAVSGRLRCIADIPARFTQFQLMSRLIRCALDEDGVVRYGAIPANNVVCCQDERLAITIHETIEDAGGVPTVVNALELHGVVLAALVNGTALFSICPTQQGAAQLIVNGEAHGAS
jgi:hypothetical protein